jgi:hypothetical protein
MPPNSYVAHPKTAAVRVLAHRGFRLPVEVGGKDGHLPESPRAAWRQCRVSRFQGIRRLRGLAEARLSNRVVVNIGLSNRVVVNIGTDWVLAALGGFECPI